MNSCCHNCPDRVPATETTPSCHPGCKRYAAECAAGAERRRKHALQSNIFGYVRASVRRVADSRHLRSK